MDDLQVPQQRSVAVPADNLPDIPGSVQVAGERTLLYVINDDIIGEPFPVYRAQNGPDPWWVDMTRVQKLILAFQNHATISEACVSAGISYRQYTMFSGMHPEISSIKDRCYESWGLLAKGTITKGLRKDHWLAWEYAKKTDPALADRALPPAPVGAVAALTDSAFIDAEGKVIMRSQTAELLKYEREQGNAA